MTLSEKSHGKISSGLGSSVISPHYFLLLTHAQGVSQAFEQGRDDFWGWDKPFRVAAKFGTFEKQAKKAVPGAHGFAERTGPHLLHLVQPLAKGGDLVSVS